VQLEGYYESISQLGQLQSKQPIEGTSKIQVGIRKGFTVPQEVRLLIHIIIPVTRYIFMNNSRANEVPPNPTV
jgi:hypothetical protein